MHKKNTSKGCDRGDDDDDHNNNNNNINNNNNNRDPVMKMVRDFKKGIESVGHQSLVKEASK